MRGTIPVWFGGTWAPRLARRVLTLGDGTLPFPQPRPDDIAELRAAAEVAGRDPEELDFLRFMEPAFTTPGQPADLGPSLEEIPGFVEQGYTTLLFKPDQYIDTFDDLRLFFDRIVARMDQLYPRAAG